MTVRQTLRRALPPLLGSILLAGCAAPHFEIQSPCSASALLRQSAAWERLNPEQLDAAYARARGAFERSGGDCDRLRIALLTVLQGSRRSETYALKVLDEYPAAKAKPGDERAALARLLSRLLREQVDADGRMKAAAKKTAEEQSRADACRRQLDELRNVEKIIDERGAR